MKHPQETNYVNFYLVLTVMWKSHLPSWIWSSEAYIFKASVIHYIKYYWVPVTCYELCRREIWPAPFKGVLYIKKTSTLDIIVIFHTGEFLFTSNVKMGLSKYITFTAFMLNFFKELAGKRIPNLLKIQYSHCKCFFQEILTQVVMQCIFVNFSTVKNKKVSFYLQHNKIMQRDEIFHYHVQKCVNTLPLFTCHY